MYKRIYYDGSKIHLWEVSSDDKTSHEIINHEIEYYVLDKKATEGITDIFGNPVRRCVSKRKEINDLLATGAQCCETDISEVIKFLQKRYAGKKLNPDITKFKIANIDIECESDGSFPYAEEAAYPINLISLYNFKSKRTYTFGNRPYTGNSLLIDKYQYFETEEQLLNAFIDFFKHCGFDIVTGWNVMDFDIKYIINRCKNLGIEKTLSPVDNIYVDSEGRISIGGLSILDYQTMYTEFLKVPMSSYSLHFVSLHELGKGKLEYEGTISTLYKNDWNTFVEYNITDVKLVTELDNKLKLIHLCITLAYQTLIPFEKTISTIPLVEGYLLKILHENKMVMNNRIDQNREEYAGGYCFAKPGFYYDVLSFDVESMYPHLIMMYNISPETIVKNPENSDGLIRSPVNEVFYKKDKIGFLPTVVKGIFKERKIFNTRKKITILKNKKLSIEDTAKRLNTSADIIAKEYQIIDNEKESVDYYHLQQYVRKILLNSFYGVLANPFFHFYNVDNAKAITIGGQTLIKHLAAEINNFLISKYSLKENPVVIIDTDSCYIEMKSIADKLKIKFDDNKKRISYYLDFINNEFKPIINTTLLNYAEKYNVNQLINFKHEKIITKQAVIVKKHYISETIYNEGDIYETPAMKYTGVQTVRSDTPEYCRGKLVTLINKIFETLDRKIIIKQIIKDKAEFEKQPIDRIASTKGLNKFDDYVESIDEYLQYGTSYPHHCPIQIKAAIAYNYLIARDKLSLVPAGKGAKIKYIYVFENNIVQSNIIGFIGQWPKEFNKYFKIDYNTQFEKTFLPIIEDLFKLLKWEDIEYEENILDNILF